jgi:hypothetical protein
VILVCFKTDGPRSWTSPDPDQRRKLSHRIPAPDTGGAAVLTDEFAPVERLMTRW